MTTDLPMSDGALEDFAALIDVFTPMAKGLLERDGTFPPFAGYLDLGGAAHGVVLGEDTDPDPDAGGLDELENALRRRAAEGDVKAAVIFADVRLGDEETVDEDETDDAVLGRFEHADGSAIELFLRYHRRDDMVVFRDPSAVAAQRAGLTASRH